MTKRRDTPTAEQVAHVSGGDVETERRALDAITFDDEDGE
jgi:hypothetical protein